LAGADEWYEDVKPGEELAQGQILPGFRILQPTYQQAGSRAENLARPAAHVIILTQSCDLLRPERTLDGIEHNVLIAPLVPFSLSQGKNADNHTKYKLNQHHWLPASKEFAIPYSTIAFALTTSVPYDVLVNHAKSSKCCKLRSPYVEHLGHRFGDLFSRIALPEPSHDDGAFKAALEKMKLEQDTKK
jgi:hypothetical protein